MSKKDKQEKKRQISDTEFLDQVALKKEQDLRPTFEQRVLYYLIALFTSIVPLYLYSFIFGIPFSSNAPIFGVVTIFSAAIITFAYHNSAYTIRLRLLANRQNTLQLNSFKEVPKEANKTEFLNAKKAEQERNTTTETIAFSVLFNNLFFLSILGLLAFLVLPSLGATNIYNYVVSVSAASAFISFVSAISL